MLTHNANIANEGFIIKRNKRKASSEIGSRKNNTQMTMSSSSRSSESLQGNSVAEQRKRASLFRESLLSSTSHSEQASSIDTKPRPATKKGGKSNKKIGVKEESTVAVKANNDKGSNNDFDPVERALAEARRKEQARKVEIAEKLKSQQKEKRARKK